MLSNCFGMVYGYILDNVGFFPCRLATSIPFSLGLALMVFYENRTIFTLGVELVAIGGIGVLLTNITIQPIWPKKTSTIGSIFSGVFDGSAGTILLLKLLYEAGIPLKFLFIGLFALTGIQWWRTFFVLPAQVNYNSFKKNKKILASSKSNSRRLRHSKRNRIRQIHGEKNRRQIGRKRRARTHRIRRRNQC